MEPNSYFDSPEAQANLLTPPFSHEAECSVLGGLLLENKAWDRVADLLKDSDFYVHEHRLIFASIGRLINAMKPADVLTVAEDVKHHGQEEDVGGLVYLNELAQYVPSAGNIRRYAEIIRERAILRNLASTGTDIVTMAMNPAGRPVAEILDTAESSIFRIAERDGRAGDTMQGMDNLVVQLLDMIQERADDPREIYGTPTGLHDLDRQLCGLQNGDLVVLAARPSMGKTALALNIAEHVALNEGLPVVVFSMEMGSLQLAIRMVASIGRINQQRIRTGKLQDDEWSRLTEAVEKLRTIKLKIDEKPGLTINELRSSARKEARNMGGKLGLIVVDYLQLMQTSGSMASENRATAVGELSRGLKSLAKEMDCPVIALSQLSRAVESRTDKRPMMSDLRESGAIEQDADVIMFIYRDDYYNTDSKEPGVAEIIVSKARNGPTGTVKAAFIKDITRFESLARYDSND